MDRQWKLVPVEPTETMVINGFESEPNECFTDDEVWEQYQDMSGCQQAAFRAKLCWAAMLASAPEPPPADAGEVARLTAEREALQLRLNAADQRIDELERDKARLDALESNCWDVRYDSSPNGDAGDSSISIEIVGHWMDTPFERVIGENYSENLRAAIDQAMTAPAYPPARPEYPEPEATKDDDWHMNPCKQGHRDVGAAGGIAHCYTCDEKIEAATTQEAFERWNATHSQQ